MKPNRIALNIRQPAGSLIGLEVSVERGQITVKIERVPEKEGTGYVEPPKTLVLRTGRPLPRVSKKKG